MTLAGVHNDSSLHEFMTEPSPALVEAVRRITGTVILLGGSGKMGPELAKTLRRADQMSGINRDVIVASTFGNHATYKSLEKDGVRCIPGDLTDPSFINSLPRAGQVIYMLGYKFGSGTDWHRTFYINSIVPYLIGERFRDANIVVFSSTNPYASVRYMPTGPFNSEHGISNFRSTLTGGSREDAALQPQGVYGWSIVAREASFANTAARHSQQRICNYRLSYAQHFCYGVLRDLADMIYGGSPISLAVPAINLISQRDAIDVALRSLEHCANPPWTVNVSGPGHQVSEITHALGNALQCTPKLVGNEGTEAPLIDDNLCLTTFGQPRDGVVELINGVARWVESGGASWDKPTLFGSVNHVY